MLCFIYYKTIAVRVEFNFGKGLLKINTYLSKKVQKRFFVDIKVIHKCLIVVKSQIRVLKTAINELG